MNYSGYINAIGGVLKWLITDNTSATPFQITDYNNILPSIINYAELRMYTDYDFLSTIVAPTTTTTSGTRTITTPSSLVVLQSMNIITPSGKNPDDSGSTRNPVQRTSIDFLNGTYPSIATTGVPVYYAYTQTATTTNPNPTNIALGATPDSIYTVECLGTARPNPLTSSNTTTFLTLNLPDVFIAASLIYAFGYQRDFGAQSADPQSAQSWENQYQLLKMATMTEELRKKAQSANWEPYLPSNLAPRQ